MRLGFNSRIGFVEFLKDEEVVHYEVAPRDVHKFDYSPNQSYPWALRSEYALFTMSPDGSDKRVLALSGNPLRPALNQEWDPAYDAPTPTPAP